MSVSIKRIIVDENNRSIVEGTGVVGDGSLLAASGDDRILQDSIASGIGILIVDFTETGATGVFTVNLPTNVSDKIDDQLEFDSNSDVTFKTPGLFELDNNGDITFI
tara:strand:- start:7 stop:327 length:321 start_codon:yes stop_codon:yes gene_type:complete